jgi:hypothetical protein
LLRPYWLAQQTCHPSWSPIACGNVRSFHL